MFKRCLSCGLAVFLLAAWPARATAQVVVEAATVREAVVGLLNTAGAGEAVGLAVEFAAKLEVANTPFGSSAGGFVFKLDPATGLRVRTAPTFGPSFAERALTAGEG
jgi:hypothetical protein